MRRQVLICDVCKKEAQENNVVRIYIGFRLKPQPNNEVVLDDVCSDCEYVIKQTLTNVLDKLDCSPRCASAPVTNEL